MAGDGRFHVGRHRDRFGSRGRPGACRLIAPVPCCYRHCSLSGGDCRPVSKIPCFHGHGNSRHRRPHFAPGVPSAGRMSPSTVNRGAGSGFQPNLGIRKADLHVSVRDTRSGKRQVWDIDRSRARASTTIRVCLCDLTQWPPRVSVRTAPLPHSMNPRTKVKCKDATRRNSGSWRWTAVPMSQSLPFGDPNLPGNGKRFWVSTDDVQRNPWFVPMPRSPLPGRSAALCHCETRDSHSGKNEH